MALKPGMGVSSHRVGNYTVPPPVRMERGACNVTNCETHVSTGLACDVNVMAWHAHKVIILDRSENRAARKVLKLIALANLRTSAFCGLPRQKPCVLMFQCSGVHWNMPGSLGIVLTLTASRMNLEASSTELRITAPTMGLSSPINPSRPAAWNLLTSSQNVPPRSARTSAHEFTNAPSSCKIGSKSSTLLSCCLSVLFLGGMIDSLRALAGRQTLPGKSPYPSTCGLAGLAYLAHSFDP